MTARRISKDALVGLGAIRLADLVIRLAKQDPSLDSLLAEALTSESDFEVRPTRLDAVEPEPYLVGSSPAMRRVFERIRKFAPVEAPVLITGESGTGKELAAHAIHERSSRASGPFVVIDCASLPSTLIGSELFGHEKGSFTGAYERKIGRIERAEGGTVFLDEVGDLPLEMQSHLLRFLQEGTIERIGGKGPLRVDARVVAATNVDVAAAVEEGRFREDLFYRLNVLTMEMPALRDRAEDIDLLSTFFLRQLADEMKVPVRGLSDDARKAIRAHQWPGNVRELIACIRRAIIMAEAGWINPEHLSLPRARSRGELSAPATLEEARHEAEKRLIYEKLRQNDHNIKKVAGELKISRPTLYRLLEKHQIKIADDQDQESTH